MSKEETITQGGFINPPRSYWIASTSVTDYPALDRDIKVDAAIIGGGIAGITTAFLLKREGLKVAIIEANHIIQGATAHTTAKITSQHGLIYDKLNKEMGHQKVRQYAEANESAIRMIENLVEEKHIDCDFSHQSAYVYTQQDEYVQKIEDEYKTAAVLGIKASYLEDLPLPFSVKAAVRFDNQAQFHPRKYLLALVKEICGDGSHIFEQTRVVDIEEGNAYSLITAHGNKVIAPKVVIASHYPCFNKSGLYFTKIYTEMSYIVAVKAKDRFPGGMYITAEEPGRSLRSQPSEEGELILVAGEHHKTGQGENTTRHYEALKNYANEVFEVQDIPYRWSTQDCMTMDGAPYAGLFTSKNSDIYVATGFGKWGMTNSTASAMIIRDLITTGKSPWEDVYNPSRFTPVASAKSFVTENLNVAGQLIAGKLTPAADDVDIKPGEAKVIEKDDGRTGAYRDEEGKLHLVDTTCTHLGCELNWNAAERSWDCPCHGSRFTYDGDIVEGPALKPLKPKSR